MKTPIIQCSVMYPALCPPGAPNHPIEAATDHGAGARLKIDCHTGILPRLLEFGWRKLLVQCYYILLNPSTISYSKVVLVWNPYCSDSNVCFFTWRRSSFSNMRLSYAKCRGPSPLQTRLCSYVFINIIGYSRNWSKLSISPYLPIHTMRYPMVTLPYLHILLYYNTDYKWLQYCCHYYHQYNTIRLLLLWLLNSDYC